VRYHREVVNHMPQYGRQWSVVSLLIGICIQPFHAGCAQPTPASDAEQLMQNGGLAMRQGKPAEAEHDFRLAVAADPKSANAWLGLGMSLLRENKTDEARDALKQSIATDPRILGAHMFLGIAEYQRKDYDDALALLRAETALQPNNPEVLTWIGIVELAAGHPERAVPPLDQASAMDPSNPSILEYQARAHTMVAQHCYQELYKLDPQSWRLHRDLAELFSESSQPDNAVTEFQAAIKMHPDDPELYEGIGEQYQKLSRFSEATEAYELKLDPHNATALYNLGQIQVRTGDTKAGVELLQQALEAHAPPAPTYFYLGLGMGGLGRDQEATQWLEKSLAADPSPFIRRGAWYELARLYRKMNRKEDAKHALDEMNKLTATGTAAAH
jgi:tetratricopeptide (TPR) repeat protein